MMYFSLYSAEPPDGSGHALLVEGTVRAEGIPGMGPNRIPALYGVYSLDGTQSVFVWAVSDKLVFNPDEWKERAIGGVNALVRTVDGKGWVVAIQRKLSMREEMASWSKWWFLFEFSMNVPERDRNIFLFEFLRRTEFFFSSSRRLQDLSFPATFDVTGK